jgi:hypothetical protein
VIPEHRRLQVYMMSFSLYTLFMLITLPISIFVLRFSMLIAFGIASAWIEIRKYMEYDAIPKETTKDEAKF